MSRSLHCKQGEVVKQGTMEMEMEMEIEMEMETKMEMEIHSSLSLTVPWLLAVLVPLTLQSLWNSATV